MPDNSGMIAFPQLCCRSFGSSPFWHVNSSAMTAAPTILCLASYEKGFDFLREAKAQGARVLLLTSESLRNSPWPKDSIDEIFYMPDVNKQWNREHAIYAISHLAKTTKVDLIVPLDDFDLEMAAALREHLRVPGMGETTTRYFRDKLAMRGRAQFAGLPVPEFVQLLNQDRLREFMQKISPPWVLKPRSQAGAIGIKKMRGEQEVWDSAERLGDQQSFYLLERYVPGDIFHVDSIFYDKKMLWAVASRYGAPPMDVSHGGGVFTSRTLSSDSAESKALTKLNREVLESFGFVRGVSHTEFIRGKEDGKFYFLETSARVGGANLADMIEAATGLNMWREWAKIELAGENGKYAPPRTKNDTAGILVSLARQEWPDTSGFNDPEVVWRMKKQHHVGVIVKSENPTRVEQLLADYTTRIQHEFMASAPAPEKPVH
jgi:biotin carboxylase